MNWDKLEKEAGQEQQKQFKSYAPNGEYKVKLEKVEVIDRPGWKAPAVQFIWAEDNDYKYPKSVNHWLSLENAAWRAVHQRNILMTFGFDKKKAEALIETTEKNTDREKLKQAYEALYKKVAERHPEVAIIIQDQYRDNKPVVVIGSKGTPYTPNESDFASSNCRVMKQPQLTDPLAGAEEVSGLDGIF